MKSSVPIYGIANQKVQEKHCPDLAERGCVENQPQTRSFDAPVASIAAPLQTTWRDFRATRASRPLSATRRRSYALRDLEDSGSGEFQPSALRSRCGWSRTTEPRLYVDSVIGKR
jgi:hypothetical protein